MKTSLRISSMVLVALLAAGCGSSSAPETSNKTDSQTPTSSTPVATDSPATSGDSTSHSAGATPVSFSADTAPDKIVAVFLESLRSGDKQNAEGLLTDKARRETRLHGLEVQPPGTPNAKYKVGKIEYITAKREGAHVHSQWIETDAEGNQQSYEIVWILRRQENGWRIAGLATPLGDSESPLVLNFEDPEDLLRKWRPEGMPAADEEAPVNPNQQASQPGETPTRR